MLAQMLKQAGPTHHFRQVQRTSHHFVVGEDKYAAAAAAAAAAASAAAASAASTAGKRHKAATFRNLRCNES